MKAYYGVLERQFRRYIDEAVKAKENSGDILVQNLERRLDNIVYRLGFALTLRQVRQMVIHGHFLINGRKINIPSYRVKVGDDISLRDKSKAVKGFVENFKESVIHLGYLQKDMDNLTGKLVRIPRRDEIPIEVRDSKVLELYSRY